MRNIKFKERVSGIKSLIIGKRIQINWKKTEVTKFDFKHFNSIDMFYFHIVLFHKCVEFHYYHRL